MIWSWHAKGLSELIWMMECERMRTVGYFLDPRRLSRWMMWESWERGTLRQQLGIERNVDDVIQVCRDWIVWDARSLQRLARLEIRDRGG